MGVQALGGVGMAAGDARHGRVVGVAPGADAEGVFGTRPAPNGGTGQAAAAAHAGIAVGDAQRLAFPAHDRGADADPGGRLDEVAAGEGGERLHALLLRDAGDEVGAVHGVTAAPGAKGRKCGTASGAAARVVAPGVGYSSWDRR